LDGLFAQLGDSYTPEGHVPPETRLGHFHLHVADLETTRRYYHDLLGFDDMGVGQRYRMGMVSAGGYHHHIGFNTWQGQNAPPAPPDAVGLDHIAFRFSSEQGWQDFQAHLEEIQLSYQKTEAGLQLQDPSQNTLLFQPPA